MTGTGRILIALVFGTLLAACGTDAGGGAGSGFSARTLLPVAGATGVVVNPRIAVTFSQPVSAGTVTVGSFTLRSAAGPVAGNVTVDATGMQAVFTPWAALAANTPYTASVTSSILSVGGRALTPASWSFTTGSATDGVAPSVASIIPADGATGVSTGSSIAITFSEPVDPFTVNTSNVAMTGPSGAVPGYFTYSGTNGYFFPYSSLASATTYSVNISGVMDLANNALSPAFASTFTTAGPVVDTTPPTVTATTPPDAATGVGVGDVITATFSEPMTAATITDVTFTVTDGVTPVTGTVSYSGDTAIFTQGAALAAGTGYTATITTGAQDLAGNGLATDYTWGFVTATTADTTPPTVISTVPADMDTNVAVTSSITINFSELMDLATLNTTTITVDDGGGAIAGTVTASASTATFTPSATLTANATYTVTVSVGVQDLSGNALAVSYGFSFSTADSTPPSVVSTVPADQTYGNDPTASLSVTFDEPVDAATLVSPNIGVWDFATDLELAGSWSLAGNTATFTPSASLPESHKLGIWVDVAVTDLAGNPLSAFYYNNFGTGGRAGRFAYAAASGATSMNAYDIDAATGALSSFGTKGTTGFPQAVIVDTTGGFLFAAVSSPNEVHAYAIGAAGALTLNNKVATSGGTPVAVCVTPDGQFVYAAESATGVISRYPLSGGFLGTRATAASGITQPTAMTMGPRGYYLYVSDGGTHELRAYEIDRATGVLTLQGSTPTGIAPSAIAVHPAGWDVFVTNESDGTVSVFENPGAGGGTPVTLTEWPGSPFTTGAGPTDVAVHPSGTHVYVANGGANSVSWYDADIWTYTLTPKAATVPAGAAPSAVSIDPSGQFAYVANQGAASVSAYSLAADGTPTLQNSVASGAAPGDVVAAQGP